MDHKVSKDMISSGMIPSGEKTQADLGRTQYGSAPSPNKLMDAYKSMYEHHKKDADGNTIPHEGEELNEALPLIPLAVGAGGLATAAAGGKLFYDSIKGLPKKMRDDKKMKEDRKKVEEGRGSSPEQLKANRDAAAKAIKKRIPQKGVMGDYPISPKLIQKPKMATMNASHDLESKGENLDEINAGYSTDPGLAATPKPKVSNLTRQGKERTPAQMAAAKRIASSRTIADVKAANTAAM